MSAFANLREMSARFQGDGVFDLGAVPDEQLIVTYRGSIRIINEDGTYPLRGAPARQLLMRLNHHEGLRDRVVRNTPRGRYRSNSSILDEYSTLVDRVEFSAFFDRQELDVAGCVLRLPVHQRSTEVVPGFDADVDAGLRAMAGKSYDKLEAWILNALDVRQPCPALHVWDREDYFEVQRIVARGLYAYFGTRLSLGHARFNETLLDAPLVFEMSRIPNVKGFPTQRLEALRAFTDTRRDVPIYRNTVHLGDLTFSPRLLLESVTPDRISVPPSSGVTKAMARSIAKKRIVSIETRNIPDDLREALASVSAFQGTAPLRTANHFAYLYDQQRNAS